MRASAKNFALLRQVIERSAYHRARGPQLFGDGLAGPHSSRIRLKSCNDLFSEGNRPIVRGWRRCRGVKQWQVADSFPDDLFYFTGAAKPFTVKAASGQVIV